MQMARRLTRRLPPASTAIALLALLLAAFGLRVFGLDWDDGQYLHPDERHVVDVLAGRISLEGPTSLRDLLDPATSGLNPRSADPDTGEFRPFAYGALPLLVTNAGAAVVGLWSTRDWDAYGSAHLIGRSLSALLDTLTVLVVYSIGARVFDRRVALLGALVAAVAPMSIQLAHFFTTDSWLTFFVALCLLAAIRAAEGGRLVWFAATGASFGLAMATKGSVFTLAGVVAAAAVYDLWRRVRSGRWPRGALHGTLARVAVAGAAAVLTFALFEPYAILRPDVYLRSLVEQAEIVSGRLDVPYTRQYVGTTPVLYQVEQVVRWGFGPVSGVLSIVGVVLLARRFWRERTPGQWLLLAWLCGYGLVVAVAEAKFLRYLAPLVPVLAVAAGLALDAIWRWVERRAGVMAGRAVVAVLLVGAMLWTAGGTTVYAHENTRLAASRWILTNVPSGSALSDDFWDDALPMALELGLSGAERQYDTVTINLYADQEPSAVADEIYGMLEQVDYVVLSSNRVEAAMPRAPWRYPVQARYYELLRSGSLGFELAAEFARPPTLGPLRLVDHDADESFVNYDHPRVRIYRKARAMPRPEYDRLMSWATRRPWSATRQGPEQRSLLLDQPVGELPAVGDARWSAGLTGNSAAALAAWLALLGVMQVVGWPLASLVFGRFADAGWGFSRLVALLTSGYLVWIGASTRLFAFRATWAALAVAVVAAVGWAGWRTRRRRKLWRFAPPQRRTAIGAELLFWAVFALFLLFRYFNPDGWHPFWGGEKPMEFAHLNATLRSAHFPPYDPWYADGYLNYYYYGLYLVAFCLKLTGIPSEIGFNLAQPTVMALLASGGYSLTATLGRDITRRTRGALMGGVLGAGLLVGVGNLVPLRDLITNGGVGLDSFFRWTWTPSRALNPNITEFPLFTGLYADLHAHAIALPITVLAAALGYSLARDRRLLAVALSPRGAGPSRVGIGARLGLLALTLGTLSATNAWDVPVYAALAGASLLLGTGAVRGVIRRAATVVGMGALLGLTSFLLFLPFFEHYVALFGSLGATREPLPFGATLSHLGGLLAVAIVGLVVALIPGDRRAHPSPFHPVVVLTALLALFAARGVFGPSQPGFVAALDAGMVVIVAAALAGAAWLSRSRARSSSRDGWPGAARPAIVVGLGAVALMLLAERVVLAGFAAVALGGAALWLRGDAVAARFAGLLVAAAASIGAGTEVVFLADDLIGTDAYRMNTIFKFYNQVWVLLAVAAATLVARMADEAGLFSDRRGFSPRPVAQAAGIIQGRNAGGWEGDEGVRGTVRRAAATPLGVSWARAGLAITAASVAASLLYPLLAVRPRLEQRFTTELGSGTLNAWDWMDTGTLPVVGGDVAQRLDFAGDRAAIDWFNRKVDGSPVVAEASIGPYRCNGSRISIGTGLPTIIGWERHQQQQRYPEALGERVDDVHRLYASPDADVKRDILARYNVAYVVVGPLERLGIRPNGNDCAARPRPDGIAAFERMVGTDLDVAFAAEGTTVYRVRPAA